MASASSDANAGLRGEQLYSMAGSEYGHGERDLHPAMAYKATNRTSLLTDFSAATSEFAGKRV